MPRQNTSADEELGDQHLLGPRCRRSRTARGPRRVKHDHGGTTARLCSATLDGAEPQPDPDRRDQQREGDRAARGTTKNTPGRAAAVTATTSTHLGPAGLEGARRARPLPVGARSRRQAASAEDPGRERRRRTRSALRPHQTTRSAQDPVVEQHPGRGRRPRRPTSDADHATRPGPARSRCSCSSGSVASGADAGAGARARRTSTATDRPATTLETTKIAGLGRGGAGEQVQARRSRTATSTDDQPPPARRREPEQQHRDAGGRPDQAQHLTVGDGRAAEHAEREVGSAPSAASELLHRPGSRLLVSSSAAACTSWVCHCCASDLRNRAVVTVGHAVPAASVAIDGEARRTRSRSPARKRYSTLRSRLTSPTFSPGRAVDADLRADVPLGVEGEHLDALVAGLAQGRGHLLGADPGLVVVGDHHDLGPRPADQVRQRRRHRPACC